MFFCTNPQPTPQRRPERPAAPQYNYGANYRLRRDVD